MIVVDSTVILAWGVNVAWSAEAADLLEEPVTLLSPQSALTRAMEALAALVADGHVDAAAFARLALLLPASIGAIVADQGLAALAAEIVASRGVKYEAALCLALASAREATLATADAGLARAAVGILPPGSLRLLGGGDGAVASERGANEAGAAMASPGSTRGEPPDKTLGGVSDETLDEGTRATSG